MSASYESILVRSNDQIHKRLQSVSQDLGNNLVNRVAKSYGAKILHDCWHRRFGNKGDEGVVELFKEVATLEERLNHIDNVMLEDVPIFLEEARGKPSGPGALKAFIWNRALWISSSVTPLVRFHL